MRWAFRVYGNGFRQFFLQSKYFQSISKRQGHRKTSSGLFCFGCIHTEDALSVVWIAQDAQAVAKVLGKEIRFLDIDKKPRRAALAAAPAAASETLSLWEEGRRDGQGRRPVVVLLGHFNHGKTTILDALLGPSSGIAE